MFSGFCTPVKKNPLLLDSDWKIARAKASDQSPQNDTETKFSPFEEIEAIANKKIDRIDTDLEYSVIQIKSPSYSDFFNSVGSGDKFYKAMERETKKQIQQSRFIQSPMQVESKIENTSACDVPMFVIKVPPYFREERMKEKMAFQKRMKKQIAEDLEQIYSGKFKIGWQPSPLKSLKLNNQGFK